MSNTTKYFLKQGALGVSSGFGLALIAMGGQALFDHSKTKIGKVLAFGVTFVAAAGLGHMTEVASEKFGDEFLEQTESEELTKEDIFEDGF